MKHYSQEELARMVESGQAKRVHWGTLESQAKSIACEILADVSQRRLDFAQYWSNPKYADSVTFSQAFAAINEELKARGIDI